MTTNLRRDELTFRGNRTAGRHGWLRLTPAYAAGLVAELLPVASAPAARVLDPFCGTGTTALVCAERGLACDTTEINPFLRWLAAAKTRVYTPADLAALEDAAALVAEALRDTAGAAAWLPPLYQIEKWWDAPVLAALGRARAAIAALSEAAPAAVADLLLVAFCRLLLAPAHVSFAHQSMSFRAHDPAAADGPAPEDALAASWAGAVALLVATAGGPLRVVPRVLLADARTLDTTLDAGAYTHVITSPPYPNRVSYIRELRPYMYWLGYLRDGRAAGDLDWAAIGGTWGVATSRLAGWTPDPDAAPAVAGLVPLVARIAARSLLLAHYVQRYFHDMDRHCRALFRVVRPGGQIHYIVGNSKFYDVLLPVETLYAALFAAAGFTAVEIRVLRKRSSKKELYEFLVSARKPAA